MKNKFISSAEACKMVKSDATVMIGGFLAVGGPNKLVDELEKRDDLTNLTLIANDTGFVDKGLGKLVVKKMAKKVIASHIGTNKETGNQMNAGVLDVELVPQGTLAERIRAGGYGLGGVLTPTGIGTIVANGKDVITVDGKPFLLEKPLKADIALLKGTKADKCGNIFCAKSTKNFNSFMAFAAQTVVVEVEEVVDGCLSPEEITIPYVLVDYVVKG